MAKKTILKTRGDATDDFAGITMKVAEPGENPVAQLEADMDRRMRAATFTLLNNLTAAFPDVDTAPMFAAAPAFNDPAKPNTLPVPISKAVALPGFDAIRWSKIGHLPAYVDPRIRRLGAMVFGSFPCFRAYAEKCKADGLDPHAEVLLVADPTNKMIEVQMLARLIIEKGAFLEKGVIDYGVFIPGYNPEIGVFLSKSWTFKLVRDRVANGSMIDANSIYAWPGGLDFYQAQKLVPPAGVLALKVV